MKLDFTVGDNKIVAELITEEKTQSGIILQERENSPSKSYRVVKVSEGNEKYENTTIVASSRSGTEIEYDGKTLFVFSPNEIHIFY